MLYTQPPLLDDEFLARELSTARRHVDELLSGVREFTVIAHEHPWVHLDDLLADLRAAAVTVSVLEDVQAKTG